MPNLNQGPLIKFQAGSQRLMATKGKDAVHGKEKRGLSPSSPRSIGQSQGRRTPKSSCSGSPDQDLSILSDKPIPNYLRPTISSRNELCKYGKKQESEDRKLNRRRSFDKPPSPSQVQKTPLTASSRERTLKPSSPSPKTATSPKLISERILKTPRNGTTQPLLANQKSIKKSPHSTIKKEPKVTNTTNSSSSTISNPDMEGAEEKREGSSLEQVKEEMLILEGEKEIHLETPPAQNPKAISLLDHESKNPEDEKPEPCESSNLSEEPMAPQIEEADQEKRDEQTDHEDEEHDIKDEEHNNHPEVVGKHSEESLANEVQDEVNVKEGEEGLTEKANILRKGKVAPITEDSGDENQPNKVEFREGKELGQEEEGDGESQRLKFKENEDVEVMEVANPEQENVVLKQRQDVQGKKESPAYNDVIEETASKLVGKRKSKVKALVGAFETVISLQEPEGQQSQQTDKAVDDETTLNESSSS